MTALELYKYINNNGVEWHRTHDKKDVWICLNFHNIEEFFKMIGTGLVDEEGMNVIVKDGYIVVMMESICEYHDINIDDIFVNPQAS